MARQFRKPGPLDRHYVREWRERKGLTEDQLAEAMGEIGGEGLSKTTISVIENQKRAYNQHFLEVAAQVLECQPQDLLAGPPPAPIPEEDEWKTRVFKLKLSKEQGEAVLNVARQMGGGGNASSRNDNFVTPKDTSTD